MKRHFSLEMISSAVLLLCIITFSFAFVPQQNIVPSYTKTGTKFSKLLLSVNNNDNNYSENIKFNLEDNIGEYLIGLKKTKKGFTRGDNRNSLPFFIREGQRELGTYLLDSSTGCDDVLDLSGSLFKVDRVRFLYKFTAGEHRVFKKRLDVTSTKTSWSDISASANEDNARFLQ